MVTTGSNTHALGGVQSGLSGWLLGPFVAFVGCIVCQMEKSLFQLLG